MRYKKDGGLAWLVSLGAFSLMFLETGMVKSLGVLLPMLREQFSTHTWVIGLVISLAPGFGGVTCVLAAALNKRFSPRFIVITFSLLSSIGLIMGSFAMSVGMLAIAVLLTGFSSGAEGITIAILPYYFDKYYDVSNSIAHVGLSLGIMTMPLLTQVFLDLYGWRGTILLLGGLNFHQLVCGGLLRPLKTGQQKGHGVECYQSELESTTIPIHKHTKSLEHTAFNIESIIVYLDLNLFKNFNFLSLFCINIAIGYYYTGWLIYLVPHGIDLGFQPYQASALATVGGIGNLIGNIVFPFAAKVLSHKVLFYLSIFIASLALAMDPIVSALHSYVGLLSSSCMLNLGYGVHACCIYKVLLNVVGKGKFTSAVNWIIAGASVGSVCSGFLSGWLFDRFGNYMASFLFLSAVPLFSLFPGLMWDIRNYIAGKRNSSVPCTDSEGD